MNIQNSIGRFATTDGKRRGSGVHATLRPASAPSTAGSSLQPHQRRRDRAEQRRGLASGRGAAASVQAVCQPLQHRATVQGGQLADEIVHQHGQGLGQPLGRQVGGCARRPRGEG